MTAQLGLALRDRGEQSARDHASKVVPSALSALRNQIEWLADSGVPFTSESVLRRLPATVRECLSLNGRGNAVGACFTEAARSGLIQWTGEVVRSSSTNRRGGMIRVWRGTGR